MTNSKMIETVRDALGCRQEWEQKLARAALQRYCKDRAKVNNVPWPRASNVRYPLSDMLIEQKKPFLFQLLFASEQIAVFKSVKPVNGAATGCGKVAAFFDFVIKERTRFEEEIQYAADSREQDGETIMKTYWDTEKCVPCSEQVDNIFIITPPDIKDLDSSPWIVHVLQLTPNEVKKRFKDVPESEMSAFLEKVKRSSEQLENDSGQKEKDEYSREGISKTSKEGKVVLWENHYQDEAGGRRRSEGRRDRWPCFPDSQRMLGNRRG